MGTAEFIIGPAEGRTRWLHSPYELVVRDVGAGIAHSSCPAITKNGSVGNADCGRASAVPFISLRINLDLQGYVGKRFAGPR
jgi:hypothetical protein